MAPGLRVVRDPGTNTVVPYPVILTVARRTCYYPCDHVWGGMKKKQEIVVPVVWKPRNQRLSLDEVFQISDFNIRNKFFNLITQCEGPSPTAYWMAQVISAHRLPFHTYSKSTAASVLHGRRGVPEVASHRL